jgi:hypothetical protein
VKEVEGRRRRKVMEEGDKGRKEGDEGRKEGDDGRKVGR